MVPLFAVGTHVLITRHYLSRYPTEQGPALVYLGIRPIILVFSQNMTRYERVRLLRFSSTVYYLVAQRGNLVSPRGHALLPACLPLASYTHTTFISIGVRRSPRFGPPSSPRASHEQPAGPELPVPTITVHGPGETSSE